VRVKTRPVSTGAPKAPREEETKGKGSGRKGVEAADARGVEKVGSTVRPGSDMAKERVDEAKRRSDKYYPESLKLTLCFLRNSKKQSAAQGELCFEQ